MKHKRNVFDLFALLFALTGIAFVIVALFTDQNDTQSVAVAVAVGTNLVLTLLSLVGSEIRDLHSHTHVQVVTKAEE